MTFAYVLGRGLAKRLRMRCITSYASPLKPVTKVDVWQGFRCLPTGTNSTATLLPAGTGASRNPNYWANTGHQNKVFSGDDSSKPSYLERDGWTNGAQEGISTFDAILKPAVDTTASISDFDSGSGSTKKTPISSSTDGKTAASKAQNDQTSTALAIALASLPAKCRMWQRPKSQVKRYLPPTSVDT